MVQPKKAYFTTPIFYPNDVPHLGTAYPVIAADILARWSRLQGIDTFFLTGTDEHGKKIELAAEKNGRQTKDFVDDLAGKFVSAFKLLGISNDRFIRTTDTDHIEVVRNILQLVFDKGDIYRGSYSGLYCVDCEAYYNESDLNDRCCPVHYKPVELLEEDCYFFRMSKYEKWLLDYYRDNPNFIVPESRRNEVVRFVEQGLEDLCISRSTFKWGIPIPFDDKHVTYVWFDALINYLTGIRFLDNPEFFKSFWPQATHIIGKDILRFHAAIWPIMLHAAGLCPPRQIVAHGFWTVNGRKFSKSLGNVIRLDYLVNTYGADPLRYYMFQESLFGSDGDFSEINLVKHNNKDLAQGLGNLLNRLVTMVDNYANGTIPSIGQLSEDANQIALKTQETLQAVIEALSTLLFKRALDVIWDLVRYLNAYITQSEPWKHYKEGKTEELNEVLGVLAESMSFIACLVSPFMPETGTAIARQLGFEQVPDVAALKWGNLAQGLRIGKSEKLFQVFPIPIEKLPDPVSHRADQQILDLGISYAVAQIHWVKVKKEAAAVEQAKRQLEQEILKRDRHWYRTAPEAMGYDELYVRLGKQPGEIDSPLVSLTNYIFESSRLPQINVIVDMYNVFSLTNNLSIGAHDREKITGDIQLSMANSAITYLPLGATKPVDILPGEYYWNDNKNVLCRLDVKQGEATKIDEYSRHIVLLVQGHKGFSPAYIKEKTEELCKWIISVCGGEYILL